MLVVVYFVREEELDLHNSERRKNENALNKMINVNLCIVFEDKRNEMVVTRERDGSMIELRI